MNPPDNILWVDLECTGSNVDQDEIIEIACILTDPELNELRRFTSVVKPGPLALGRMLQNPVVREMHTVNGLIDDVLAADDTMRPHLVANRVLDKVWGVIRMESMMVLGGSGVGHYDKKFIDKYMPLLSKRLRYYVLDVGVIRRAHRLWVGDPVDFTTAKTHRALDDIECHLQEARHYRDLWRHQTAATAQWNGTA